MKKALKANLVRIKIQTRTYSRKLPESIQTFDVMQVENCKIFVERPSSIVILCFRQWHIFQKWGVFQRSKGHGYEKFSQGPAPRSTYCSLRSHLISAPPPNINFVPTGLNIGMGDSIELLRSRPRGDSLLVSDGGSDIFWVCKTLSSIPLGTRFGA